MTNAIRYHSVTGNTKKLAEAIGETLGVPALPLSEPLEGPVDLLFLGSSMYAFSLAPEVRQFVKGLDAGNIKRVAVFGTAAMMGTTAPKIKKLLKGKGVALDDRVFHCRGAYRASNPGRPNDEDVAAVRQFAEQVAG